MACHLSALFGLVFPLGFILGPLIVWLVKRDDSAFVDAQGKEALNFQLTMLIAYVIASILVVIVIGIPLLIVVGVLDLVFVIIAAAQVSAGTAYRYPFAIRFIR